MSKLKATPDYKDLRVPTMIDVIPPPLLTFYRALVAHGETLQLARALNDMLSTPIPTHNMEENGNDSEKESDGER